MKKFVQYWIDTYFLFSNNLISLSADENYILPKNYSLRIAESEQDGCFRSICLLWEKAYYSKIKYRSPNRWEMISNEVMSLLQQGNVFFGLCYHNRIVGMGWLGLEGAIQQIDFAHIVKKERAIAIGHHDFIEREHRGHGFQRVLAVARRNYAKMKGCQRYYVFVGVKNLASIRNLMKISDKYKIVFHLKVDVPLVTFNFFPGQSKEKWMYCSNKSENLRE